jgi:hypothetical protein
VAEPSLAALSQAEKVQAQKLASAAAMLGASAIHSLTITAASMVLKTLARSADDTPAKLAAQLRALRSDFDLVTTASLDVARAGRQALDLIISAIQEGYRTDLPGRARVVEAESTGLRITITITRSDIDGLKGYPIIGHTAAEISAHLATRLRYEVDGALGNALGGPADPATITGILGNVALAHGTRLGDAVRAGFYAGTQAAQKALGMALTGQKVAP